MSDIEERKPEKGPEGGTGAAEKIKNLLESPGPEGGPRETFGDKLQELTKKPKRSPIIHWAALVLSIISLAPLIIYVIKPSQFASANWYWWDVGFSVFFMWEFITRSGFRWNPSGYIKTHFFDFVAIVPALVLAHYSVWWSTGWVWVILIFRVVRALDRILGDGFIPRNVLALLEALEEEITDRVMLRILARVRADLTRGKFGVGIGQAIQDNKDAMLKEIRSQHPRIVESGVAHAVGISQAVERAEENVYDSIVKILKSPELDKTIRNSVDATFSSLEKEVAEKAWKKNLGFKKDKEEN